ncbi:MAG: hypothetical protein ACK4WH_01045 [Phycisphaerales bacterium]
MATITVNGFCAGGGHVRLTIATARRGSHTFSLDTAEWREAVRDFNYQDFYRDQIAALVRGVLRSNPSATRAQLRAAIEAATFLEPD